MKVAGKLFQKVMMAEVIGATVRVPLTRGHFAVIGVEDAELVLSKNWHVCDSQHGLYAATREFPENGKSYILKMHRLIKGCRRGDGIFVDHRNRNGLDNRRKNLRRCTPAQSINNRGKNKNGRHSQYRGVCRYVGERVRRPLWRAYIVKDYKQTSLGIYESEQEAAKAYNRAAKSLFGEFASLNVI